MEMEFLHKDEFTKQYASKFGHKFDYPVILSENNRGLEMFISKQELSEIKDEEELIAVFKKRLKL